MNKVTDKKYMGIVFIIFSAFCFALMSLFVKLAGDLPSMQKSFFRNLIALIFAFFILIRDREKMKVLNKEELKYLILRSTFGTIGILCNFYAVDNLVLSDASMLNKMSPFFVILFSYFLLKEKITTFQTVAVIISFIGSLFIIKPSFEISEFFPSFIGLMGGLTAGVAYTMVRKLGNLGVKGSFIVFFFSSFSCVALLPYMIFNYVSMSFEQLLFLLLAGLSATGGQFGITFAYHYAPAREISIYDYSQILFSSIFGVIIFGQIPDKYSVFGYIIIIGMAILMYFYNNKKIKIG